MLAKEYALTQKAYELLDNNHLQAAIKLTLEIEASAQNYQNEFEQYLCRQYVASCLIDIGDAAHDENMIRRGIDYLVAWQNKYPRNDDNSQIFYNIASGYFACWKLRATQYLTDGENHTDFIEAVKYYRLAIDNIKISNSMSDLACRLWTDYGNALDSVGRSVEAVVAYETALGINPSMGLALGNKALSIIRTASWVSNFRHRFYIEAKRLLENGIQDVMYPAAKEGFELRLKWLNEFINAHAEMLPEEIERLMPTNKFHTFLCKFCAEHRLFLNPITLLGDDEQEFYGDPMFINRMSIPIHDNDRADRYVTFLNEIKQDYVLGRYFLVQSQYQSDDLDSVDEGVSLIYPLDYSLQSVYIQLLKSAMKQAISVLDKVAYFIYDYCGLSTPAPDRVTFRQLFGGSEKMRSELGGLHNLYLFALFSLSREVSKQGYWKAIYDDRDALTHRFLVLHDMNLAQQPNKDIPRELESAFLEKVILATKIARAAVMYLIMFVATEENKLLADASGPLPTINAVPLDKRFRHRPSR